MQVLSPQPIITAGCIIFFSIIHMSAKCIQCMLVKTCSLQSVRSHFLKNVMILLNFVEGV